MQELCQTRARYETHKENSEEGRSKESKDDITEE